MQHLKNHIPWWGKIATKLVLSRLPVDYTFWKKLSLFDHGLMEEPSYAYANFKHHFEQAKPKEGFASLELGPGDSLFSALISSAFGGSKAYLIDAGEFALKDLQLYHAMANFLIQEGLPAPNLHNCQSLKEVLACCSAQYMTSGLSSLQTILSGSVDLIFSTNVLEHIKRSEFLDLMRELRRVISDKGMCSHKVDLKDHMGYALNNLRFSEQIWESNLFTNSGFYTNRIQYSQMLDFFGQAGFEAEVTEVKRWPKLPTPRSKFSKEFIHLSDEELCVSEFSVLLRPV